MTVQLFLLLNGDSVLADSAKLPDGTWLLKNPVRIVILPPKNAAEQQKGPSIGFAPWQELSNSTEFNVHSAHILTVSAPLKELESNYQQMFSKLILPESSKLIIPN